MIQCLPLAQEKWSIPQEEFSKRLDLRTSCIFTIDPATARDLDDALSCERLDNGNVTPSFSSDALQCAVLRSLSYRCSHR